MAAISKIWRKPKCYHNRSILPAEQVIGDRNVNELVDNISEACISHGSTLDPRPFPRTAYHERRMHGHSRRFPRWATPERTQNEQNEFAPPPLNRRRAKILYRLLLANSSEAFG